MYEVFPKKKDSTARNLAAILFIVAVIAMYISTLPGLPLRSLVQLLSVGLIAFGLVIMGRYIFSSYSYAVVRTDEGGCDFIVTEIKRRSRITVCRISVSGIESVEVLKKGEGERLAALKKGRKSFDYRVDMMTDRYCCILANECGEAVAIKISYDERLISLLSEMK